MTPTADSKDLTSIMEVSKELEDSGQAPPPPAGSVLEETPIEKIDDFESLADYSAHSESLTSPLPANTETTTGATTNTDAITNTESETPIHTSTDFPVTDTPPFASENSSDLPLTSSSTTIQEALPNPSELVPCVESLAIEPVPPPPPPQASIEPMTAAPLKAVKQYSEQATATQPHVSASFPFSVLIEGPLTPPDQEKLLDCVVGQNMGIRELDLEPQLKMGRVLIPRISEYAAIFLVQALRGISAQIKMGPADLIFATDDTRASSDEERNSLKLAEQCSVQTSSTHPAENLPITTQATLAQFPQYSILDTLSASGVLQSTSIETDASSEYQELLEALQRELKYKAYRRGAVGILQYHTQLIPLSSPTLYRVQVIGLAILNKIN